MGAFFQAPFFEGECMVISRIKKIAPWFVLLIVVSVVYAEFTLDRSAGLFDFLYLAVIVIVSAIVGYKINK